MDLIKYGVLQARRAWLGTTNVLNTLPLQPFKRAMKKDWAATVSV